MAGHNKWKQIKDKKSALDKKRSALFSKMLKAITVAAREGDKPEFNPKLKAAIDRAKQMNVPQSNIERALKRVREKGENLEEVLIEAYGPSGIAFMIEAITDSKMRTIQEVKQLLKERGGSIAEPGATAWAFETSPEGERKPKFEQDIAGEEKETAEKLLESLEEHEDVQNVYTNLAKKS